MQLGPLRNLWQAKLDEDLSVADELKERIRVEQVALLYRNSTTGFVVSIAAGALLAVTLSEHIPFERIGLWYGLLLAITAARYYVTQRYKKSLPEERQSTNWETLIFLGAGCAGLRPGDAGRRAAAPAPQ